MTLEEIAGTLGVSKSTVSRALSGKGRIGEETRQKILQYIQQDESIRVHPRTPSRVKTRNLGVVFPLDYFENGNPYFQDCMLGICESAALFDFNILIALSSPDDISGVQSLIDAKRIDGIILTRSLEDDRLLKYLTDIDFPTGLTGQCEYPQVLQVDTDNRGAAQQLTSLLIGKGFNKFALLLDTLTYHVNRRRYDGVMDAFLKNGLSKEHLDLYTGPFVSELLDSVIENIFSRKTECIICGDDVICSRIMSRLQAAGYRIPKDVAIASLYNSATLNCFSPAVTAIEVAARSMGNSIGKQMTQYLLGKEYESKIFVDYDILFRKSTNRS